MTRKDKELAVASLSEKLQNSSAFFVVDYKGLDVETFTGLRKKLGGINSEIKVVRNSLAKIAINNTEEGAKELGDSLTETNAFVFSYEDVGGTAKEISNFAKDSDHFTVKSGFMDGNVLSSEKITYLATLPSKDELRAKLLSVFNAPATQFVRVLNAVPQGFVTVLSAYKDEKEG